MFARVINIQLCSDLRCPIRLSLPRHLILDEVNVELRTGNATAISYTWGNFNRKRRLIGHFNDERQAMMKLGEEWVVDDLVTALEELCKVTADSPLGYCWIDQLCIVQDDKEEVRETLARIPDIYRTFEVAVLIPGGRCTCMTERLDKLSPDDSPTDLVERMISTTCPNDVSYVSWLDRLWPLQEFCYGRSVRFVWVGKRDSKCPNWWKDGTRLLLAGPHAAEESDFSTEQFDALSVAAQCHLNFFKESPLGRDTHDPNYCSDLRHVSDLRAIATLFPSALFFLLGRDRGGGVWGSTDLRNELGLLRGEKSYTANNLYPGQRSMETFSKNLSHAMAGARHATRAVDFVFAIWADCPGYVVPSNYLDLSLAALLEDALHQLRQQNGMIALTTAPSGLFGLCDESLLWKPSLYFPHTFLRDTKQVYSTFMYLIQAPIRLRVANLGAPIDLQRHLDMHQQSDALIYLSRNSSKWVKGNLLRLLKTYRASKDPADDWNEETQKIFGRLWGIYGDCVMPNACLPPNLTDIVTHGIQNVSFYQLVRQVIGHTLGLQPAVVEQTGLRVMMRHETHVSPVLLGLTSRDFANEKTGRSYLIRIHNCNSKIECRGDDSCEKLNEQAIMYEAEDVDANDPKAGRRVIGVWAPVANVPWGCVESSKFDFV